MAASKLTKQTSSAPDRGAAPVPIMPTFEGDYPNLFAYLFQDRWEDGSTRQTTTLLFFSERGELKCCVNDRDAQRTVFLTCSDVQDALRRVEDGLEGGTLDWRQKRLAR